MKKKTISVIGLGFVGLPLACILANYCKKNTEVIGIDKKFYDRKLTKKKYLLSFKKNLIDKKMTSIITKAVKNNNFHLSNDFKKIKNSETIVVSVNFDFKIKNTKKSFNQLKDLFKNIALNINRKALIILETTVPPGTSEKVIFPLIKKILKKRKFKNKIFYAYSYERVMPGVKYYDSIVNINRCYSGVNLESKNRCEKFLKSFINVKKYPLFRLENLKDCETSKILENSYRAVNIAFIDEWTKYTNKIGVNLNRVIDGIKFRETHKNIMRPGLGVGGYCLTKDPSFAKISGKHLFNSNFSFPITSQSMIINRKMPDSSVKFLEDNLPKKKLKILILGASYRQDVGDIRFSASIDLYKKLKKNGNFVLIQDPLVLNSSKENFIINKLPSFKKFDAIIFCVAHKKYKKLKFTKLPKNPYYFDLNMVLDENTKKLLKQKKYKLKVLGDQ